MNQSDMGPGGNVPDYGAFPDQSALAGQPRQEEEARLGPVERLTGTIFSPGETFADINRRPTWLVPMVISIVLALGFSLFFTWRVKPDYEKITRDQIRRAVERSGQPMPPDDQIRAQAAVAKVIGTIAPVVFPPLFLLLLAGIFALGLMVMSAQTTFKKILSVVTWSNVATGLVYILVAVASLMMRDPSTVDPTQPATIAATNLGAFISTESGALRALLGSIDIFTIWFLILLSIGFAAIAGSKRFTTGKTATLVFGLWACWLLIRAGIGAAFGQ
ncbi:MAG TPA: YIP1 family protein [Blastocatellia bacterium]|nr:YIP1 family protein [Blastocatellia bacterium]